MFNDQVENLRKRREKWYRYLLDPDNFIKSDRLLSKEFGCDHKTVSSIRGRIITKLESPTDVRDLMGSTVQPVLNITEKDIQRIRRIIQKNRYIGLDGKMHPRKTRGNTCETEYDLGGWKNLLRPNISFVYCWRWENDTTACKIGSSQVSSFALSVLKPMRRFHYINTVLLGFELHDDRMFAMKRERRLLSTFERIDSNHEWVYLTEKVWEWINSKCIQIPAEAFD